MTRAEEFDQLRQIETDDCILFPHSLTHNGYARLRYNGSYHRAHVLSLQLAVGDHPIDKPLALHTCRKTRHCINPRHLYWGDGHDNQADRVKDDTHNRGDRHWQSKLTNAQVLLIRDDTRPQKVIAKEYGISVPTVSSVKSRKVYGSA